VDDKAIERAIAEEHPEQGLGAAQVARMVTRAGLCILRSGLLAEEKKYNGAFVTAFRVRFPNATSEDFLMVFNGVAGDGTPVVAFHSAETFAECIVGGLNRCRNGSIFWKKDEYGIERGGSRS
jgi:hypothetical protein